MDDNLDRVMTCWSSPIPEGDMWPEALMSVEYRESSQPFGTGMS